MKFKIWVSLFIGLVGIVLFSNYGYASDRIEFGPAETDITASIKYTVIGKYKAQFDQFKGEIIFDKQTDKIQSVYLEIEASTIESSCQWCDKIVRSKQLLDTEKYPKIIFKSNEIIKDEKGYSVRGILDMHGVKKEIVLPFESDVTTDEDGRLLSVNGKWIIKRKDFDIVWNKFLDKGGVLVGNYITVDWGIKSVIKTI